MAAITFRVEACPHCGSDAAVVEHPVYKYRCQACGQPRIPVAADVASTPPHVAGLLKQVRKRHLLRGVWQVVAFIFWGIAFATGLVGAGLAYVAGFQVLGLSILALFVLIPVLLGWWAKRTAGASISDAKQTLSRAWSEMAQHVYALGGNASVEDFKRAFGVDTDSAMALLAEAEVEHLLSEEQELGMNPARSQTRGATTPRVRVPQANQRGNGAPAEQDAELEREALAELKRELNAKH